jgi:outer membrane PBP1 activator LpoA protein
MTTIKTWPARYQENFKGDVNVKDQISVAMQAEITELRAALAAPNSGEAAKIADALRDGINSSHDCTDETCKAEKFLRSISAPQGETK